MAWSSITASSRISTSGRWCDRRLRTGRRRGARCGYPSRHRRDGPCLRTRSRSFWARQPETTIWRPSWRPSRHLQMAEVAVQLVVGVLPDAAGVEHDHVGVVLRVGAGPDHPPRAARRCVPSRARSSGTRRCARRSCEAHRPAAMGLPAGWCRLVTARPSRGKLCGGASMFGERPRNSSTASPSAFAGHVVELLGVLGVGRGGDRTTGMP